MWKEHFFSNFTVSRKRALGETVKLEKTCCIHIKHVGISILHAGDTSEPCFYKTSVECLDKTNIYTKLVFAENIKAF